MANDLVWVTDISQLASGGGGDGGIGQSLSIALHNLHYLAQVARAGRELPSFYVRYSTLLHKPSLRFHCVGGCWDRTQDSSDFGIVGSQSL
jgi:hypothetical protein